MSSREDFSGLSPLEAVHVRWLFLLRILSDLSKDVQFEGADPQSAALYIHAAELVRLNVQRIYHLDELFFDLPFLNLRVALVRSILDRFSRFIEPGSAAVCRR